MNSPLPTAIPSTVSFNSLAELKAHHRALLERADDLDAAADVAQEVQAFLAAAVALGTKLSLPAERAEAQRLLDYWVSSSSTARQTAAFTARQAILEPYAGAGESSTAMAAEKFVSELPAPDKALAKRLLLRLVQLESDGTSFGLVTRHESLLTDGPNPSRSKEILLKLTESGLIVAGDGGWLLSGSGVLSYWEEARGWLAQRRRLRGAARFWEAHGRNESALLEGGDLLDEAAGYLDLNELEREFVERSKGQRDQRAKHQKLVLIGWLASLAGLCAVLAICCVWALDERNKAVEAKQKATEEKQRADEEKSAAVMLTEKLRQQGKEQGEERLRQEQKMRAEYEALLEKLEKFADKTPLPQQSQTEFKDVVQSVEARAISKSVSPAAATSTLQPGFGVFVRAGGQERQGTVGVFLEHPVSKRRFLVGPRLLLADEVECRIYRISRLGETPNENALIAINPAGKKGSGTAQEELVAVELTPGLNVRNVVSSVGALTGIVEQREGAAGMDLVLVGLGSGFRQGKVVQYDTLHNRIITTRISTTGDAGAPVVTPKGKVVGILGGSQGAQQSFVIPLPPFIERSGLRLLSTEPATTPALEGAMVQLIVPIARASLLPRMKAILDGLRAKGVQLPDGEVLRRRRTPQDQTEVRYYYSDDLQVANAVQELLQQISGIKARTSFVSDDSVPRKMIQVSFALPDLKEAYGAE